MQPIFFLSPSFATTSGHRTVTSCLKLVSDHVLRLSGSPVVPVCDEPPYSNQLLRWIAECRPAMIVVDWPDMPIADAIHSLKHRLGDQTIWMYLGMMSSDFGRSEFVYDIVAELEPEAQAAVTPVRQIAIEPLVNPAHLVEPMRTSGTASAISRIDHDSVVWFESGTPLERDEMWNMLRAEYGTQITRSSSLSQPALPLLRLWPKIVAAGGYSSVWELNALGLVDSVRWFQFDRPLEDVERRVKLVRRQDAAITQLGEASRTGCGLLRLARLMTLIIKNGLDDALNEFEKKEVPK